MISGPSAWNSASRRFRQRTNYILASSNGHNGPDTKPRLDTKEDTACSSSLAAVQRVEIEISPDIRSHSCKFPCNL